MDEVLIFETSRNSYLFAEQLLADLIANPENLPNMLVVVSSAFAACKFVLFTVTYIGVVFLSLSWLVLLVTRSRKVFS
jgi:hypothetical protein